MSILLKGGTLIVGNGDLKENTDILIEGNRIKKIARDLPLADLNVKQTMDMSGKSILPGLIDCHVHIHKGEVRGSNKSCFEEGDYSTEQSAGFLKIIPTGVKEVVTGLFNAKATLEAGYTTIRHCGGNQHYSDIVMREAIRKGIFTGPRLLACGGGMAMTGGHAWQKGFMEVDGPEQTRRLAREQLKAGADILKVMATHAGSARECPGGPEFTVEEMRAVCEEAHKRGKRVAAHAIATEGIKNALRAGVDTIEHGEIIDDECIDMMLKKKAHLVSTITSRQRWVDRQQELGFPIHKAVRSRELMEVYPQSVKKAKNCGVNIGLGIDAGIEGLTPHGENASEISAMVKLVGLSEMEAICLATKGGATVLGLEEEIGTLQEGKLADILVINGNPLKNIDILCMKESVFMVIMEGTPVVKDGCVVSSAGF